jgi:K+ transporter
LPLGSFLFCAEFAETIEIAEKVTRLWRGWGFVVAGVLWWKRLGGLSTARRGAAATGTMLATTVLLYYLITRRWHWRLVVADRRPRVPFRDLHSVRRLGHGCYHITVRLGFLRRPDIPLTLENCASRPRDTVVKPRRQVPKRQGGSVLVEK